MVLQSQVIEYHTSNLSWISCHMLSPDWSQFAIDGMQHHSWENAWHAAQPLKDASSLTEPQLPPPQTHPYTHRHPRTPPAVPGVLCIPLFSPFLSFFKAWPAFLNLLFCLQQLCLRIQVAELLLMPGSHLSDWVSFSYFPSSFKMSDFRRRHLK